MEVERDQNRRAVRRKNPGGRGGNGAIDAPRRERVKTDSQPRVAPKPRGTGFFLGWKTLKTCVNALRAPPRACYGKDRISFPLQYEVLHSISNLIQTDNQRGDGFYCISRNKRGGVELRDGNLAPPCPHPHPLRGAIKTFLNLHLRSNNKGWRAI